MIDTPISVSLHGFRSEEAHIDFCLFLEHEQKKIVSLVCSRLNTGKCLLTQSLFLSFFKQQQQKQQIACKIKVSELGRYLSVKVLTLVHVQDLPKYPQGPHLKTREGGTFEGDWEEGKGGRNDVTIS